MSCANSSARKTPKGHRIRHVLLALYRVGIIIAAFVLVRHANHPTDSDPTILLAVAQRAFPEAVALGEPVDALFPVLDAHGTKLGWAARTFPAASRITGYAGPTEAAVILDTQQHVRAVELISSADTAGHVAKLRADPTFWSQWNGMSTSQIARNPQAHIVTGATLTSQAVARGMAARFGATGLEENFPQPLTLDQLRQWFPEADAIDQPNSGRCQVSHLGQHLGTVLRNSRLGIATRGFNGPSDVLVAIDPTGTRVLGIALAATRDNEPYATDVRDELRFAADLRNVPIRELLATPDDSALVVTGASITASALMTDVREMLRRELQGGRAFQPAIDQSNAARASNAGTASDASTTSDNHDPGRIAESGADFNTQTGEGIAPWVKVLGFSWIAIGTLLVWARAGWLAHVRRGYWLASLPVGVLCGWLLGQDQWIGWARHGVAVEVALPWLVLSGVALVVPALTGKNPYCASLCPHGAAQVLAGRLTRRRLALPAAVHRRLQWLPWASLLAIWGLAVAGLRLPFSQAEPFEVWSSGWYALLPAALFTLSLLAASVLPRGYCHYGCPTGALFKFLTHARGQWTRRDSLAAGFVAAAALLVLLR